MPKNHIFFMQAALDEARAVLTENEFPVGCIMVYDNRVVASGTRKNSGSGGTKANELDHAEILTLRNLLQEHPEIDLTAVTIYSTMEPCLMCFSSMLISGIRNFVYAYEDAMGGGTNLPLASLNPLYKNMQINITPNILRPQSLALFKSFFSNTDTNYLQDTLLAQYTLSQNNDLP